MADTELLKKPTKRQKAELTAKELAQKAEIGLSTVYEIEQGRVSPTIYTVTRMADALKISIDEYIGRTVRRG